MKKIISTSLAQDWLIPNFDRTIPLSWCYLCKSSHAYRKPCGKLKRRSRRWKR